MKISRILSGNIFVCHFLGQW